jgi:transposase
MGSLRAELIMKVRCGLITARQAAKQLGVSRKTFYKWEQRGLSALLDSVTDQQPGRPSHPPDEGCQVLEKQLLEAKREIESFEPQNGAKGSVDGSEASRNRLRPDEKKMKQSNRP